jgi:hypothetical protein
MSIELLPFSAFALETCAPAALASGEGQTLTLSLRRGRVAEPMAGQMTLELPLGQLEGDAQHASIPRTEGTGLTITF